MPTINNYIDDRAAFDPETISVMGVAYERALASLPASTPRNVREVIAAKIIGAVRKGERNPDKLLEMALAALRSEAAQ